MKSYFRILMSVFTSIRVALTPKEPVDHRFNIVPHSRNLSINKTMSFSEIAANARETLDFGYEKIGKQSNTPFSDEEWGLAGFYLLPRRAVFSITINHGGMFLEEEIFAAKRRMVILRERAILSVNPLKLAHRRTAMLKAAIRFHEAAGEEERATREWKEAYKASLIDLATHLQNAQIHVEEPQEEDLAA